MQKEAKEKCTEPNSTVKERGKKKDRSLKVMNREVHILKSSDVYCQSFHITNKKPAPCMRNPNPKCTKNTSQKLHNPLIIKKNREKETSKLLSHTRVKEHMFN